MTRLLVLLAVLSMAAHAVQAQERAGIAAARNEGQSSFTGPVRIPALGSAPEPSLTATPVCEQAGPMHAASGLSLPLAAERRSHWRTGALASGILGGVPGGMIGYTLENIEGDTSYVGDGV